MTWQLALALRKHGTVTTCDAREAAASCKPPYAVRVHLTVCTVDFTIFTVAITVFLTFVFLNFESENTGYRYRVAAK